MFNLSTIPASQPKSGPSPTLYTETRDPYEYDTQGYHIGDLWLNTNTEDLWYLGSLAGNNISKGELADWIQISSGAAGAVLEISADAGAPNAFPDAGVIAVIGGTSAGGIATNINTVVPGTGNEVFVNLNNSISQPNTSADSTKGMYSLGGSRFMHDYGTGNTFLGGLAGNLTLTTGSAQQNTGLGFAVLSSLDTGVNNTVVGAESGQLIETGSANTLIGAFAGELITGSNNVVVGQAALSAADDANANTIIGNNAGLSYTTNESSNVLLSNAGIIGDSHIIRIGQQGSGSGQQNLNYQAGITGVTVATPTANKVMQVGTDGQLGEAHLFSSDASVTITQGAGTINLQAAAGGGGGGNPFAFNYSLPTTAVGVIGDATTSYFFGTTVVLNSVFDSSGGSFYPGSGAGAPATFTAPVTGKYYFKTAMYVSNAAVNPCVLRIITPSAVYAEPAYQNLELSEAWGPFTTEAIVSLNMNDVVTFAVVAANRGVALSTDIVGDADVGEIQLGLVNGNHVTWIEGFLISQGSSGGDFTQPFNYYQPSNFVFSAPYTLGTSTILGQLYDVGSNFFPGGGTNITPAYFEAPVTGIYTLGFSLSCFAVANDFLYAIIQTPSTQYLSPAQHISASFQIVSPTVVTTTSLNAGDQVNYLTSSPAGAVTLSGKSIQSTQTYVWGQRIG